MSQERHVSKGYLSKIENGKKTVNNEFKNQILKRYGYSSESWRNFATEDKRGKSIPTSYRLSILLQQLDEKNIDKVFQFVKNLFK